MAQLKHLAAFLLVLILPSARIGPVAAIPRPATPATPSADLVPAIALPQPVASVIARVGDPAPGVARVRGPWGGGIALTPTGGRLFVDTLGNALYLAEGGEIRVLVHVGEPIPGLGVLRGVWEVASGGGAIAALVGAQDSIGGALVRVTPLGGVASLEFVGGQTLMLRGGPVTVINLIGPAVDGAGRIVFGVRSLEGPAAILRRAPGGSTEILVQTGDPLGASTFVAPLTAPAANAAGAVVFDAETAAASHVLALRAADGALTALFEAPVPPCLPLATLADPPPPPPPAPPPFCPSAPLGIAPPAINDAGDVAFLWSSDGSIRAQRVMGGVSQTVAAPGSPAPDQGTFAEITGLSPAIDPLGGVIFGAVRSNALSGVYVHRSQSEVVAEEGGDAGGGRQFGFIDVGSLQAAPAVTANGTIVFAAVDTEGDAIFARAGSLVTAEARAGDPVAGVARFVSFFEFPFPYLGAGPAMAPNGDLILDGRITGGNRGLYARRPGGPLRAIALDGDPAPGGGHFDGEFMSFHSINDDGIVAFLSATPDTGTGSSLFLFLGPGEGPLARILGVGDPVPGSASPVSGFLPPSRVNAGGAIVLSVVLADGTVVLLGWDGVALRRVAGPGDVIPGAGAILQIRTGVPGQLLPPLLDDEGNILFGATTAAGGTALYSAPLVEDGSGSARRVLGAGDPVEGGVLQPFSLRMMSSDASGRLAFQAVPAPGPLRVTYYSPGGIPLEVIAPGDTLPGVGTVTDVLPHLAAAGGEGIVHEVQAGVYWLLLAVPRTPPQPAGAAFDQVALLGPGRPSPDGGFYLPWVRLGRSPGGVPGVTDRLASNGGRFAAMLTLTSAGPETLVLFDLRPNLAPGAAAGDDQTVECAGPAGAVVTLDGTASADPEQGPLAYEWSGPFGTAAGAQPVVTIPLGTWVITLTVRDAEGAVAADTVTITVRDTVAPSITVRALPATLWPPDGSLRNVFYSVAVGDLCDPAPRVILASIAIDDPKGADPATEIAGASYGTPDRIVMLRARRGGGGNGRTYTATYRATDASGNSAGASALVLVPQSQGK